MFIVTGGIMNGGNGNNGSFARIKSDKAQEGTLKVKALQRR